MWFWLLQVPTFATSWLSYHFFSGADLRVGIDFTNLRLFFDAQLGAGLVAVKQLDGIATYVGVNSVALAASLFHMREQRNLPAPVSRTAGLKSGVCTKPDFHSSGNE
jgi:hypothetical protein